MSDADRVPDADWWGPHWNVSFSCRDCRSSTSRVVRNHPEEVSRCLVCERRHVRKVSQRVLELALGAL